MNRAVGAPTPDIRNEHLSRGGSVVLTLRPRRGPVHSRLELVDLLYRVHLNSFVVQLPLRDTVLIGEVLDGLNGVREGVVPGGPSVLIADGLSRERMAMTRPIVPEEDGGGPLLPLAGRANRRGVGFANSVS